MKRNVVDEIPSDATRADFDRIMRASSEAERPAPAPPAAREFEKQILARVLAGLQAAAPPPAPAAPSFGDVERGDPFRNPAFEKASLELAREEGISPLNASRRLFAAVEPTLPPPPMSKIAARMAAHDRATGVPSDPFDDDAFAASAEKRAAEKGISLLVAARQLLRERELDRRIAAGRKGAP